MKMLSVIMPVRNEAESLLVMVKVINALVNTAHEIIVVTDNVEDNSISAVHSLAETYSNLRHCLNTKGPGVLNAVKTGVEAATGDTILIYAADEIGPILAVDQMLAHINAGCDFVSGTRYKSGGKRYGGSFIGHLLSRSANAFFTLATSTALSDCTTGIKMFKKELFDSVDWPEHCAGWSFAFHMAIDVQAKNLSVAEVPIVSIDRLFGGTSTFKLFPWIRAYLGFLLKGMQTLPRWRKPKPQLHQLES